jgi:hypothetical protein
MFYLKFVKKFYKPLRDAIKNGELKLPQNADIKTIFMNVNEINDFHKFFYSDLLKGSKNRKSQFRIGQIFSKLV